MKELNLNAPGVKELGRDELKSVVGGEDILKYIQCVTSTMGTGGGGLRSFVLGVTVFGMARMVGVMVGCSSL